MTAQSDIELLTKLTNASGVSGFEDEVVDLFQQEVAGSGEVSKDPMNNVYVKANQNKGDRLRLQIDAHSDEVGYVVKNIRPNGLIEFVLIGGQTAITLSSTKVRILNEDGQYISGVISSIPPHFMTPEQKTRLPKVDELTIDVGATSAKEVEDLKIKRGAPVTIDVKTQYNDYNKTLVGKAFDNRVGTALLAKTMNYLKDKTLPIDVVGALASQEEVGARGAQVTVRKVQPDLAIVFEGAPANDTCFPDYAIQTGIKRGPMIRHMDSTMITNPRFQKFVLDVAKKYDIPHQEYADTRGGQNGSVIAGYKGAPTIVISVPVRYAHTPHSYIALEDFQNSFELAKKVINHLTPEIIQNF
ncbi:M42 family metallopeptidase [Holzapfeliella floricola]|uniref:M42 family peptidase n=1 Tax=Holzapfeliella floricola DSM 23037 = JCM 16512 TaxID=1423744 RepID=A0A0R2DX09_9LACO|nr:M20/M25/M40 family metallo-hydrolase [Holzapfeliella floricola]KRN04861.1 M42 family peptidase [Holzapfeliella floricola DSM 23037 = JCM 16512]